ncbi:MAG TPA: glycosyltransferase family 4 protein [Kofleriaceae bacterium]|nr:glycosyltransferase family 4 protein [Kofleriaceae bacterium]
MRVLMTADVFGGMWSYALELARGLAPAGIEVMLATMGGPVSADKQREARAIANLELRESAYKVEWMEDPWADVAAAGAWLLELEREFSPDVIHLNGAVHGGLGWRAPVVVVAHSCRMAWWRAVKGDAARPAWSRYRREVAMGLLAADVVIAASHVMLESLSEQYGELARSCVIPHGRDPDLFPAGVKEPYVMSAGRLWDEAKNLAILDMSAGGIPWPVYVAGNRRHPDGRVASAKYARLLGCLDSRAMARWLSEAAIYALPARYEPFGLSVLEAALAGCALVLGDIPSLHEVWGDAAIYVSPDDPRALRRAFMKLIEDPSRRQLLAAWSRSRALSLSRERMSGGYLTLYRALAPMKRHSVTRAEMR